MKNFLSWTVTLALVIGTLGCRAGSVAVGGLPQAASTQPNDLVLVEYHDYGLTNQHTYIAAQTNLFGGVIQPTAWGNNTNYLLLFDADTSTAVIWTNWDAGIQTSGFLSSNVFNAPYQAKYAANYFGNLYAASNGQVFWYTNSGGTTNAVLTFYGAAYNNGMGSIITNTYTLVSTDLVSWYYSTAYGGDGSLVATSCWWRVPTAWTFNGNVGVTVTNLSAGSGITISNSAGTIIISATASTAITNNDTRNITLNGSFIADGGITGTAAHPSIFFGNGTANGEQTIVLANGSPELDFGDTGAGGWTNSIINTSGHMTLENWYTGGLLGFTAGSFTDQYGTLPVSTNIPTLGSPDFFNNNYDTFEGVVTNLQTILPYSGVYDDTYLSGTHNVGQLAFGPFFGSAFGFKAINWTGGTANLTSLLALQFEDQYGYLPSSTSIVTNGASPNFAAVTITNPAVITPSTNTIAGFLPITVGGTNYFIPLCYTNH